MINWPAYSLKHWRRILYAALQTMRLGALVNAADRYRSMTDEQRSEQLAGMLRNELQRALDVLCALPGVDGQRLGAIGHSAGGLMTALTMYVDPRVKAGCVSSGTFLIGNIYGPDRLRPINGFGSLLAVPGMKGWGDVDDVLAGLAPRPYLETHGDFTQEMVDEKSAKARARYQALGVEERYQSIVYDAGAHVFRADKRAMSYAWLDRWLH